jgi:hypothetical protein
MRRVWIVATVATVGLTVFATPAGAAKTNPKKFCNAVQTNLTNINSPSGTSDKAEAKRIQRALNKSAGYASGSLKSATKTLADFYGKLATGATSTAALSALAGKYAQAATTFTTYVAKNCPSVILGTTSTTGSGPGSQGSATGTVPATTIVGSSLECSADRTALDAVETAYKAIKGSYGDMDALVSAGVLPAPSRYHTITIGGGGSSYTIEGC